MVPAEPAKVSFDGFAGFAGAVTREIKAPDQGIDPVLTASQSDEVQRILTVWHKFFGINLSEQRVTAHLAALRQWQNRRDADDPGKSRKANG